MSPVFQVALVGCGAIHENHVHAILSCPQAQLAALCDSDERVAAQMRNRYNVPVYTSYSQMLKTQPLDAVHLCTPHWLHAPMATQALEAGLHVLSEKPAALDMDQVRKMAIAQKAAQKQVGICLQNRYNSSTLYMKKLIASGNLGPVLGGRGHVYWHRDADYYQSAAWRGRWETEGGGVLINQAIHTLDLLQWMVDSPVLRLQGSTSTKALSTVIEVEDTADLLLEFENGARTSFFATNCHVDNAPVEVEILCRKGSVHLIGERVEVTGAGLDEVRDFSAQTGLGKDYWGKGHEALIHDFYHCLARNQPFPVDLQAGSVCLALVQGAYQSQASGQAVSVPYLQGE